VRTIVVAFAIALAAPSLANAQQCGEPPRVDDFSLKGELDGKAKFLSSFLGDAGLKGQIETARTDVFSKYPNADRARSDSYLQYMLCTFVLSDPKLTPQEKFRALQEFRQPSITTSGPQSPVIQGTQGDVRIEFGAPAPQPK
jgi:hypothetical protein